MSTLAVLTISRRKYGKSELCYERLNPLSFREINQMARCLFKLNAVARQSS